MGLSGCKLLPTGLLLPTGCSVFPVDLGYALVLRKDVDLGLHRNTCSETKRSPVNTVSQDSVKKIQNKTKVQECRTVKR